MILVTGGAGFIGSVLVKHLNEMGREDIVIVDNLGKSEKWKNLINLSYIEYVAKDDFFGWLEVYFEEIEVVFHLGACSSTTEEDADYLYANNFQFSRDLAIFCLDNDIRFIYASSAATYGAGEMGYSDADKLTGDLKPLNMYGYSKLLIDKWVLSNGLENEVCGLRFFNVFGPNEYHKGSMKSMVYRAYYQILEKGGVKLFKSNSPKFDDGEQMRDFVYVKDVVNVILWLWKNEKVNGIFNVGTGNAKSWKQLMQGVFKAMDKPENIEFIEMPENLRNSYQNYTCADMGKLRAAGYEKEFTSLDESVRDYVQNYLAKEFPHI